MANFIQRFKDWLMHQRFFQGVRQELDDGEATESSPELTELPPELAQRLVTLVEQLPSHPDDLATVQSSLETALAEWQQQPETFANSLIILSSPVSAVSRILSESLAGWATVESLPLSILEWKERPTQPEEIANKLRHQLGRGAVTGAAAELAIAIIPNFSWCFLRSAEGLAGIDYLRDRLLRDRTQFWVIGSGQVGWEYLKSVLELRAYCGRVMTLPKLSGPQLAAWIMPVAEALEIHFDSPSIRDRLKNLNHNPSENHSDETDSPHRFKEEYFKRLADISEGISTVALQLFLHSVEAEPIEAEAPQDSESSDETQNSEAPKGSNHDPEVSEDSETDPPLRLVARSPRLPQLPTLDQNDHYLLYSLLLHGDLTLTALAESLGDPPQTVNNRVQVLRRAGLLQEQQQIIQVNPVHYPRLQRELEANNFLIEHSE